MNQAGNPLTRKSGMGIKMAFRPELEEFLADLAKKPPTSTGYWPATAGSMDESLLEEDAYALEDDLRVDSVDRKFSGRQLKQLWVVLS